MLEPRSLYPVGSKNDREGWSIRDEERSEEALIDGIFDGERAITILRGFDSFESWK